MACWLPTTEKQYRTSTLSHVLCNIKWYQMPLHDLSFIHQTWLVDIESNILIWFPFLLTVKVCVIVCVFLEYVGIWLTGIGELKSLVTGILKWQQSTMEAFEDRRKNYSYAMEYKQLLFCTWPFSKWPLNLISLFLYRWCSRDAFSKKRFKIHSVGAPGWLAQWAVHLT